MEHIIVDIRSCYHQACISAGFSIKNLHHQFIRRAHHRMGDGTILIRGQQPEKHLIHHTLLHKRPSGKHPSSNRCTRAHPREQRILSFRTTDKPEPGLSNNHNFPCTTISKLHHFTPGKTRPIQRKGDSNRSRHRLSGLRIQAV